MITELLEKKENPEWLAKFAEYRAEEERICIEPEKHPDSEIMSMAEVIEALNELTNGDAIIVTDVGQHQMVASRYAKFNHGKSSITSGGLGTMGFGLAAIGASYGAPDRTVVAVVGDGGIQMTIQEMVLSCSLALKVKF